MLKKIITLVTCTLLILCFTGCTVSSSEVILTETGGTVVQTILIDEAQLRELMDEDPDTELALIEDDTIKELSDMGYVVTEISQTTDTGALLQGYSIALDFKTLAEGANKMERLNGDGQGTSESFFDNIHITPNTETEDMYHLNFQTSLTDTASENELYTEDEDDALLALLGIESTFKFKVAGTLLTHNADYIDNDGLLVWNIPSPDNKTEFYATYEITKAMAETLTTGQMTAEPPIGVITPTDKYADMRNHKSEKYLLSMLERDIMSGYVDGTMRPDNSLTRAEAMSMIDRALGNRVDEILYQNDIADVPPSHWAYNSINWAINTRISQGVSETLEGTINFSPNTNLTLEQLVVLLNNTTKTLLGVHQNANSKLITLPNDIDTASDWSRDSLLLFLELGLIQTDNNGNLRPKELTTRAEFATLLYEYLNHYGLFYN